MADRRARLYLNHVSGLDWLIALEFGRIDDGQPPENWRGVSEKIGFLDEEPGGRVLGFKVLEFSRFDPDAAEVREIWEGPNFDAPVLGLTNASAGEIITATRPLFGDAMTINRAYFDHAIDAEGEDSLALWLSCLQAGDSMAHFGLGCGLYDVGRYHEAYRHLRHYCEIAPNGSWPWCWLGKAAEAIGEPGEARRAYERAIELTDAGAEATEAPELLALLAESADPTQLL